MRRVLVLAAALTIMWGLRGLPTAAGEAGSDPLTLAAIGFVVLAAFTIGELGAQIGLPKVTGYIVAGVVLGPQAADILSTSVVGEMRVFNTLALGLIATAAGLELDIGATRRVWKVLTAVVLLKVPLLILLVGGAFVAVESTFPSLGLPPEAIAPAALVVAVLGIGTSPAIALAVVNDGRAKGRLTDLLLAIAVVKDLVVVICLAIALALAKAMLSPAGHLDAHVLIHVAEELGSSIAVGAVLGVLIILYMRYVNKMMLLFVLLTILVVAELSAALHLELLLVFIVAGFGVRNFSPYEHALMAPLERISLPVFVVFFTTAGAGVDLIGTVGLLPLALTLVVARVVAFYIAGRVGGAIGGEPASVVDNAWLTWMPQAGVTLGLVLLAANALPDFSQALTSIGMALVAIHLLVGPITLGIGLSRAGEMGKAGPAGAHAHDEHGAHDHAEPEHAEPSEEVPRDPTAEVVVDLPVVPVRTVAEASAVLDDAGAADAVRGLAAALTQRADAFIAGHAAPRAEGSVVAAVGRLPQMDGDLDGLLACALDSPELGHGDWLPTVEALYEGLAQHLQQLPQELTLAPQDPPETHQAREREMSGVARARARATRLAMSRARRRPAFRMLARQSLEGRLAEAVRQVAASWYRTDAKMLETVAIGTDAARASEARGAVADVAQAWVDRARSTLDDAVREGCVELADHLVEHASALGNPSMPAYSAVERQVRESRRAMAADDPVWRNAASAASDHLRLASIVAVLEGRTAELHRTWGQEPLDEVENELTAAVEAAVTDLRSLRADVDKGELDPARDDWEHRMKAVFPLKARLSLRLAAQTFRQGVQPDRLATALSQPLERLPERLRLVPVPMSGVEEARACEIHELEVARRFRALLLDARVPEMCRALEPLTPQLVASHGHLAEGVEVASYGMSVASRDDAAPRVAAVESLNRSIQRLESYHTEILAAIEAARERLREEQAQTEDELRGMLQPTTGVARMQSGMLATRKLIQSRADTAGRWLVRVGRVAQDRIRARLEDPALVDRAIRTGHRKVDPQGMRARTEALRHNALGPSIAALYADRPVDDRRQFVAHRPEVERIREHVARPDPVTPLLALVVGDRGSGRTSLANVIQLSARKINVVRPEDAYHERSGGLMAALARELRCEPTAHALRTALAVERSLVLVDNFERFLLPNAAGVADVEAVLELASDTTKTGNQWVVTIEASVLTRLEELTPVASLFNQVIRLGQRDPGALMDVVLSRARLGGFDVAMEPVGSRLNRVLSTPDEGVAQELLRVSDGNLSAALAAWRTALEPQGERTLHLRPLADRSVPFVGQLPELARAALGTLHGWGPMGPVDLKVALGTDLSELGAHLQVLAAAGLIVPAGPRDEEWTIPAPLLQPVLRELRFVRQATGGDR